MNIYQQLTKNLVTRIVCTLVLVGLAVLLESKIKLISPKASLFGFYPIVLASYLFFNPISTALFAGVALQYFIINDKSFAINWSQDIWVHAFIGLGCYCLYRIKNHLDQKTELLTKKLKEEEDNRYHFTQNLAKFIKNHTRIIKQGGVFMKENPPTHEKYQKGLNLLVLKTDELDRLADDILDVSHWSLTGKMELQMRPASFRTILLEVLDQYNKTHPARIDFQTDAIGMVSLWNEDSVKRLLHIFLQNALTHGDGSKIKVIYKESEKLVNLSVQNYGEVIPEKMIPNIFLGFNKIFQKVQSHQSAGLNLSLAKAITEAHSGNIKVVSNKTEGTIFQVFMPIKKAPEEVQG